MLLRYCLDRWDNPCSIIHMHYFELLGLSCESEGQACLQKPRVLDLIDVYYAKSSKQTINFKDRVILRIALVVLDGPFVYLFENF